MVKVTVDMIRERTGMSIREFIARGATDFKFWVEALFPYRLKWFHVEWAKLYYNNKRVCIIAHRSSGKSTVLAVLFHLWMGFYEENKNFMIVSHNMSLSSRHIREMRRLIKDVELLHVLYPPDRGYSWTKTEIHLATGCKIFCKPYSENMLGYEALHFCLIDEASCLKDLSIYERTLLPMLAHHDGHLCIIGCLAPDTPILMADGTVKPLYDVKPGDRVVGLDRKLRQRAFEVYEVVNNGDQELYEVDVGGFKLKATANHPFLTPKLEWVELKNLKPGDWVAAPRNFAAHEPDDSAPEITVEEAQWLGYLIGDGAIKIVTRDKLKRKANARGHAQVTFFNGDKEIVEEFMRLCEQLGIKPWLYNKRRGTYSVHAWGERVYNLLLKFGITESLKSQTKFVPEPLLKTSNEEVKAAFLSKLFETDGSVHNGWYSFYTTSEELASGVMSLLLQLGVKPWVRKREGVGKTGRTELYEVQARSRSEVIRLIKLLKWCRKKPSLKLERGDRDRHDVIPLQLPITPEQRWKAIGYNKAITRNKLRRLCEDKEMRNWVPYYYQMLAYADIRWVRIRSIRRIGIGPTLNLRVEGGNFVANFVYTHNTPKTDTDLLARAQLPNSGFVVKKYPAIIEGKPLWPEKFPMSKLERIRKEMGEIAFAREYLLELRSEAAQAIPNEVIIKCMDPEYRFENEAEAGGEYYIGADLAMSPQGDYSVFVVLKRIGDKLLISRIERYKGMDFGTQLQYLASLWQRFKPVKMLVDESVFGSAVVEELRNKYGVPALGFKFTPQNRNAILGQLINAMKDQKIVIPRHKDCPYTLNLTDKLVHELTGLYPDKTKTGLDTYKTVTKHDDCVMALALALQAASSITVPKELIVVKF